MFLRSISVIIPALNEEQNLPHTLASLAGVPEMESIVVDGQSRDRTVEVARRAGAAVLMSEPGRARQMNCGASAASGEILLFLHADTLLSGGFQHQIHHLINLAGVSAGAFQLKIDSPLRSLRIIERTANWRARYLGLPYGDQALFVSARLFRHLGGYPDIPILEDLELVNRLKRHGKIALAPVPALTSARRWTRLGPWTTTARNYRALFSYYLGIPPARIATWYHRDGFDSP